METRVAVLSLIVEDQSVVEGVNKLLHEYSEYIIGRMGIPYKPKDIKVISLALDAPVDVTSALAKKLDAYDGVSVQVAYANV